jgi:hypothetical protein
MPDSTKCGGAVFPKKIQPVLRSFRSIRKTRRNGIFIRSAGQPALPAVALFSGIRWSPAIFERFGPRPRQEISRFRKKSPLGARWRPYEGRPVPCSGTNTASRRTSHSSGVSFFSGSRRSRGVYPWSAMNSRRSLLVYPRSG